MNKNIDKLKEIIYSKDLFIEPFLDGYLIYVPLYGLSFLCTPKVAELISNARNKKEKNKDIEYQDLAEKLSALGIDMTNLQEHMPRPYTKYKPAEVMLSLTSECSLRCTYCYINGGETNRKMPWDIAKTSIDYVYDTVMASKKNEFTISFHGEGEPSCNWPLLQKCILYGKKLADKSSLKLKVYMSTNCVLNDEQIDFVKKYFHSVSASFDILEDVQNTHRPSKAGNPSFDAVYKTLKSFDKDNFPYGLRATVTNLNINRLGESIEFVARNFSAKSIQFDPVCAYGRSYKTGVTEVDKEEFIRCYRQAKKAAAYWGLHISYSGCRANGITFAFCGAEGGNFAVSTEGFVSTCFEVLTPDDPRAKFLIIGKYNRDKKKFVLDEMKIKALLYRTANNIKGCDSCLAKWNCAGECVAKILHHFPDDMNSVGYSNRCIINRQLLKEDLIVNILSLSLNIKDTAKIIKTIGGGV